ncbi:17353_t:CDS:2 [Acaulospora morrowiae]|uniref:17353_t:CDS:1 n=1 Tax=Acaulospora morrowiae TaxID=94023 RepID=A0A9N9HDS3_9GLOM|nr:17353_t:CDS:2 [Acaulospora morrowiae]
MQLSVRRKTLFKRFKTTPIDYRHYTSSHGPPSGQRVSINDDRPHKSASSTDQWKFLFEDTTGEEHSNFDNRLRRRRSALPNEFQKKRPSPRFQRMHPSENASYRPGRLPSSIDPHRFEKTSSPPRGKDGVSPENEYPCIQRLMSGTDKEPFKRMFSKLFDQPRPSANKVVPIAPIPSKPEIRNKTDETEPPSNIGLIEKHLSDFVESGSVIKKPANKESDVTKWIRERYEFLPSLSSIAEKLTRHNLAIPQKDREIFKREISQCQSLDQLRDLLFQRLFGGKVSAIGVDANGSSDSFSTTESRSQATTHIVDDFGLPIPSNYSSLLQEAISACHTLFKDPYLAFSILEQIKRRGTVSYVLGCNTKVYNELILIRWNYWKDLCGIEELMDEMVSNGIDFDQQTFYIVNNVISKEIYGGSGGKDVNVERRIEKWDEIDMEALRNIKKILNVWGQS